MILIILIIVFIVAAEFIYAKYFSHYYKPSSDPW